MLYLGSVNTTPEQFKSVTITDLCLRKTRVGKSHDFRDVIVFEKLCFQNVLLPHKNANPAFPNSSGLKSVFVTNYCERKATVEIKLHFQIPLA